jgi:hypothetical protein
MKLITKLFIIAAAWSLLATTGLAVDLLAHYPTQLTAGDTDPNHARMWEFSPEDIFQVTQFTLKIGEKFKVETGAADLGIGHCSDGAIWAVLIPHAQGTLTSPAASQSEPVAHIWLRFHPAQINRLFPPDNVSTNGNRALAAQVRTIAEHKMTSSWQSDGKAMIPPPEDLTVFIDTKDGTHRFFIVDTAAQTAEYVDAFNQRSSRSISATMVPPVVVKTWPEAGSQKVLPGTTDIKVTFSRGMQDQSWSWCDAWENSTPESLEKPRYEADRMTCVLKVKLEPNKTYGFWLNSDQFKNFRGTNGLSAVPYLLTFQTQQK